MHSTLHDPKQQEFSQTEFQRIAARAIYGLKLLCTVLRISTNIYEIFCRNSILLNINGIKLHEMLLFIYPGRPITVLEVI